MEKLKVILSGGGTGGHIYPAVATAEALTRRLGAEGVEILFVGAEGKMEMEKVPALGYNIVGLPVAGLQRRLTLRNLAVPFKVVASILKARRLLRSFRPDVAIGFGGYASGPILKAAQKAGIPTVIQEQNSFAGVTNKLLAKRAAKICVAYDGMERFFPAEKIVHTGNPLRGSFGGAVDHTAALAHFGLEEGKPVVLVVGGSLGSRTLNEMVKANLDRIVSEGKVQLIWQNGKYYDSEMATFCAQRSLTGVWRGAFIDRMDYAYEAATVVVSRSGACSVSELCLVGKPTVFVPSPNVAEDHQTHNAMALVSKGAAEIVKDSEAVERGFAVVEALVGDSARLASLATNIKALAIADSADRVAEVGIENSKFSSPKLGEGAVRRERSVGTA
ncbi:MAG: undecaprenyldiphospho-muramoylpentapeptide beta-N-acetylglucosaminyltransferase, partial [Tidjanibacter sp.]|nr:undecaprenyldiphospho-muramoylpentapeptide beta-N-acetylglucosaminyltransferase [Tidjanibacter sp.]